jgi:hypothetical protein
MTVRKLVLPMFLVSFMTVACEEKKASEAEATSGTPAAVDASKPAAAPTEPVAAVPVVKEAVLPGPQEVCNSLVEAAKSKDDSKILAGSTPATATAFSADTAKEQIISILAGATCGAATVEGDSATIALGTAEPIKEATFSKAADGWKFDGAAFLAKYPVAVVKEKAKKAAAKVQHKAAAHSKKHH